MLGDLQGLLERVVDAEDAIDALERACGVVRDRMPASGAWVHAASPPLRLVARAGAAPPRGVDAVVARALATGRCVRTPFDPVEVHDGPDGACVPAAVAAVPLRCGGETVGALSCAWHDGAAGDARHAELLLLATATAVAPHATRLVDPAAADRLAASEPSGLLGVSAPMVALRARVRRVAAAPFHVLVDGESGSGKELVARALHAAGPRRQRRLCTVNCAALTDDLLEAELFGHARGAFTGAVRDRAGLFEEADGGTLFLDEVGELSARAQAKLLRVIQDGEIRRVGESHARRVDVRVIAATNRVLADEVAAGRFRADLRYRLEVVRLAVLPLRERPEDIAVLARAFWADAAARTGTRAALHPATLAALARYHWPGNVRELQNVVRALAVNAPPRGLVTPAALPSSLAIAGRPAAQTLSLARRGFEEQFVRAALARAGHRSSQAARDLGVSRQGLRKLLVRLGIDADAKCRTCG